MDAANPCELGFICIYHKAAEPTSGTCLYSKCQVRLFGDQMIDGITGTVHKAVQVSEKRRKPTISIVSSDINGRDLERLVESGNTYERRNGKVRQRRHAED